MNNQQILIAMYKLIIIMGLSDLIIYFNVKFKIITV